MKSHHCDTTDRPRRYYAQWNKGDRERQIPYEFTYKWNLKNKINNQTKHKKAHRHWEQTDDCQKRGGEWRGENGQGIKKYKLSVIKNCRGDIKYSTQNTVSNIVITMCRVRWALDLLEWSLHKLYKCLITMLYICS